ncbi:hypothetical protein L218DRAFT_947328 [Marasmius fiardii PR-910]|nr:hypothetical protein L218DRAFT_947328 [Marasmius fiardii PR-910]
MAFTVTLSCRKCPFCTLLLPSFRVGRWSDSNRLTVFSQYIGQRSVTFDYLSSSKSQTRIKSYQSRVQDERRGGGPPDDDPDEEPSENEPHNSEDEHNQKIEKGHTTEPPAVPATKPEVFGNIRYSSADATFNEKEIFTYGSTPQTEEVVLRAASNIPKPGFHHGEQESPYS